MKRSTILTLLVLAVAVPAPAAQPAPADEVTQQATKLEGELGKYKDTSREAAEALVQLVELYHKHGRVFGLIRATERFVAAHPDDRRHPAVMLKLIDGLEATSRNKEMAATSRQFLARYPQAPECARIEVRLADVLRRIGNKSQTADACRAVWDRQHATGLGPEKGDRSHLPRSGPEGASHKWDLSPFSAQKYGAIAVGCYSQSGGSKSTEQAAALAEDMLDKLPAGPAAKHVGYQAFQEWRRVDEWAKSNVVGNKLLGKGIADDKELLRDLYRGMAENYGRLGQHANAVEALRRARKLRDDAELLRQQIERMHAAGAPAKEVEPLVGEYLRRYPHREDRPLVESYLAHALLRSGDKAAGLKMLAGLLGSEAAGNSNAQVFVREMGNEPAALAESERVLRDAIGKNPRQACYLRYTLAFQVYRDGMKDEAKCRAVLRELVTQSPSDDYRTTAAMEWLLDHAPGDDEFRAEVARLVAARRENLHVRALRDGLRNWQQKVRRREGMAPRARLVAEALREADADPVVSLWLKHAAQGGRQWTTSREALLEPAVLEKLNDRMAYDLLWTQSEYFRVYAPHQKRPDGVPSLALMAKRFPDDYAVATRYLQMATDYGSAEASRSAALHVLKFEPRPGYSDPARRLLTAADKNEDAELAKRAYAWLAKGAGRFGKDPSQASSIGDLLKKHGMEKEAVEYWTAYVGYDPRHWESRECARRLLEPLEGEARTRFLQGLLEPDTDYHGRYAQWLADDCLKAGDLAGFERILRDARKRQDQRLLRSWDFDEDTARRWVETWRGNQEAAEADKRRVFTVVRDVGEWESAAVARLALLEITPPDALSPIERLLAYQATTRMVRDDAGGWDRLMPYAQAALGRKDYLAAATLLTGMLTNVSHVDANRSKRGREMVAQCYSGLGAVGLTIDENSPIAPLLRAALYLRLGDQRLAFETYVASKRLFDEHRTEVPVDLLVFVCERLMAAGGDENHERVEEILRAWLVRHGASKQFDEPTKAQIQLLLARNYFKAQRYDVARSEFTSVINRYPDCPQAVEAEFGIGETFMAQRVYDQAEAVFEKLATGRAAEIVIRAEFLRGVLALRRGDHHEARDIFRNVLDRVPDVHLANQTLFHLAEVYGVEQRYLDQLRLLRTVGRLGRSSKRQHAPGMPLSIVVHDSDLGISRGQNRIPVVVRTEPGGDREQVYLTSAGAGRGLFRGDLDTRLGSAVPGDHVLQLTGRDVIRSDYPDEFKAEFRTVPLSDVDIHVAADAELRVASSKIMDLEKETFSQRLEREAREEEQRDRRLSQGRPADQVKPGNLLYLRVKDADRDLSDEPDQVIVKVAADSGDQVQARVSETGPHTGVFEGTVRTGELPAGALASDSAIDHGPLLAIDRDPQTFWMSEPDGATPKTLTVDMKDLRSVSRVKILTPDPARGAPVRGELRGSHDGQFWFYLAGNPEMARAEPVAGTCGRMRRRVYAAKRTNMSSWGEVVELTRNRQPVYEDVVDDMSWTLPEEEQGARRPFAVVWHGKLVQPRAGAARIAVRGKVTAVALDGRLEMAVGEGGRSVDVWLAPGTHDLTVFASGSGAQQVGATWARADLASAHVTLRPFRPSDFNVEGPGATTPPAKPEEKPNVVAKPQPDEKPKPDDGPGVVVQDHAWQFRFPPTHLRYVRFVAHEYLGEALSVSQVEVAGDGPNQAYIPTEADVLALAANDVLEIAGGDVVTVTYTDEFTHGNSGRSRLLTGQLTATYFNAEITPISYDFIRDPRGRVSTEEKELLRVEPGERLIVRIVDYDEDRTDAQDTVPFSVTVNGGEPLELVATETEGYSGVFTKEVDTKARAEDAKPQAKEAKTGGEAKKAKQAEKRLAIRPGDRIVCRYVDAQNTFPGHAVPREAVVYVNVPTEGLVRILHSRVVPPKPESRAQPKTVYFPPDKEGQISTVALAVPLTVEVIDPDAAKDSRSSVKVSLTTAGGSRVDVACVVSGELGPEAGWSGPAADRDAEALLQGRFLGQVILQLGGKDSPQLVPLTSTMPRRLIGGPELGEEAGELADQRLVARVLNVTGADVIAAAYQDRRRPDGKAAALEARARLVVDGRLDCTDRTYEHEVRQLHVGERMFLMVTDADRDASDKLDSVPVEITTAKGERETVALVETLGHSGVFTGSLLLKPVAKPTPGNLDPEDPAVEAYFGDALRLRYVDPAALSETGRLELARELPVVIGTDGVVTAFTKSFGDETLAVETKFHVAESYFELFKSHRELAREKEAKEDLEAGRRVLREVMEDHRDPKYAPRVAYLLGQFAQELQQWDEAIESYDLIIRRYPDHSLAADAQYKLAQCHEQAGDFDRALEAYVTLAATYPKSPLIASIMIRISDHFYKQESYEVAAQVAERFLATFPGHQHAPRIAFRAGQCHYKAKLYREAAEAFDRFTKTFPDDKLCADALFWSGESYRQARNHRKAFERYNLCRWDYPESEAAKYARGRLALPEMLRQFEADSKSLNPDQ